MRRYRQVCRPPTKLTVARKPEYYLIGWHILPARFHEPIDTSIAILDVHARNLLLKFEKEFGKVVWIGVPMGIRE